MEDKSKEIRYYTGVGSRRTPENVMEMLTELAVECRQRGLILRSGAADGADTAFENGAGKLKEIYIPWKGFNGSKSTFYNSDPKASEIAKKIHPRWHGLSEGARKLHSRNVHQVLGEYLDTPSDFLICWTEGGKDVGGTATAIKLAKQHNLPVFNLGNLIDYDNAMRYIKGKY